MDTLVLGLMIVAAVLFIADMVLVTLLFRRRLRMELGDLVSAIKLTKDDLPLMGQRRDDK